MLYDMLVGRKRRAERTDSALAELKARMEQPPPPLTSFNPGIPDAIGAVIARCLEPDPTKRYQTTEDLAADLDRLDENGMRDCRPGPVQQARAGGGRGSAARAHRRNVISSARAAAAAKQHEPVSILIADFQNRTAIRRSMARSSQRFPEASRRRRS